MDIRAILSSNENDFSQATSVKSGLLMENTHQDLSSQDADGILKNFIRNFKSILKMKKSNKWVPEKTDEDTIIGATWSIRGRCRRRTDDRTKQKIRTAAKSATQTTVNTTGTFVSRPVSKNDNNMTLQMGYVCRSKLLLVTSHWTGFRNNSVHELANCYGYLHKIYDVCYITFTFVIFKFPDNLFMKSAQPMHEISKVNALDQTVY